MKTSAARLDRVQNSNLRVMEKAPADAPIAAMEIDMAVPHLSLRRQQSQVLLRERIVQCPPEHILHEVAQAAPPAKRLKRKSSMAATHPSSMEYYPHPSSQLQGPSPYSDPIVLPIPSTSTTPLHLHNPPAIITTTLTDYNPQFPSSAKRALANVALHCYPTHIWTVIYMDGSVDDLGLVQSSPLPTLLPL